MYTRILLFQNNVSYSEITPLCRCTQSVCQIPCPGWYFLKRWWWPVYLFLSWFYFLVYCEYFLVAGGGALLFLWKERQPLSISLSHRETVILDAVDLKDLERKIKYKNYRIPHNKLNSKLFILWIPVVKLLKTQLRI